LIGLTGSASLIGAISTENAEFSQDNPKGTCKRADQGLSAESDSTEISYIGPGMTVVGKISSEGTLNVFGRVEGRIKLARATRSGSGGCQIPNIAQYAEIGRLVSCVIRQSY
jgi:hypothetical protein